MAKDECHLLNRPLSAEATSITWTKKGAHAWQQISNFQEFISGVSLRILHSETDRQPYCITCLHPLFAKLLLFYSDGLNFRGHNTSVKDSFDAIGKDLKKRIAPSLLEPIAIQLLIARAHSSDSHSPLVTSLLAVSTCTSYPPEGHQEKVAQHQKAAIERVNQALSLLAVIGEGWKFIVLAKSYRPMLVCWRRRRTGCTPSNMHRKPFSCFQTSQLSWTWPLV